ncbi:amino acid permease [Streptomyces sp. SP17BM10]|uniref:amino acid permease n=1 Tax=Streptomyces sp. SP17BM10 TaxID=3002530 RepID=UPI002E75D32C|nr:amino acid permease [Streptomyces sp. SP17BM10]MEE1788808.1 amino acid permease [Streptomyces sp. SP17BM10]
MLALGGVIGAGLFVGSGAGLAAAGPAVLVSYLLAAVLALAVMRMLGELAAALPESGSFSVYARRALGPWAGFTTGWLYTWVTAVAIAVEALAAAAILHAWWPAVPSWAFALAAMTVFTAVNTTDVRTFGEAEFWFASLKVLAIVAFIAFGAAALLGLLPGTASPGLSHLTGDGGFAPNGLSGIVTALLGVVFAFGGMEVIGMAAAESRDPGRSIRTAVRSAIWRIALFYLGSVAVLVLLLPWRDARPDESPYVAALGRLGIPHAATVTQAVIVVALLSALNANLYGTSRMLHSLAESGDAPSALARRTRRGAPARAVVAAASVGFAAVVPEALSPGTALPLLAKAMGAAMLFMWLAVACSHLVLRRSLEAADRLPLRTRGFPATTRAVIAAIGTLMLLMTTSETTRPQLLTSAALTAALAATGAALSRRRAPTPEALVETRVAP